jgi:hypothetical protein
MEIIFALGVEITIMTKVEQKKVTQTFQRVIA